MVGPSRSHAFVGLLARPRGVIGVLASRFHLSAIRTAVLAALVLASHAVLDTLTDGGLGCALLWPFSEHRYFAPWQPIPVAPIGRAYFSREGLSVALTELIYFAPVLLFALWPRQARDFRSESRGG